MSKHTVTAFVHWEKSYSKDDEEFKVYPFNMSSAGCVLIGQQQIEVEVPDDFNPVPQQIAALEKEKADVRAKAARDLMSIDDRISKLQALPMSPRADVVDDVEVF